LLNTNSTCSQRISESVFSMPIDAQQKEMAQHYKIVTSLSAGAIAGAIAKTAIAPLDRTKINFQVSTRHYSFKEAAKFIKETYRQQGFIALYRGNSATMARVIPFAAVQYCAHEQWKHVLQFAYFTAIHDYFTSISSSTPLRRYIAGSMAGVTATSVTYPLDLAKACLSVSRKSQYKTLIAVFVKIWHVDGPLALYRGIIPTLLGVIPYAGTSFFTFESLKNFQHERTGRPATALEKLIFGAIAGLCGQSASYPLDIVRRRMQTGVVPQSSSISQIVRSVAIHEGVVHGLYKGLSMNWIKGPIAVGISFTVYDTFLRFIRSYPSLFS
ncbi:Mitochondrial coenzyme A transporter SLC25A42, partial [Trichinella sp. T6]